MLHTRSWIAHAAHAYARRLHEAVFRETTFIHRSDLTSPPVSAHPEKSQMAKVISIHEYDLNPAAHEAAFRRALRDAERRGLFRLPGLVEHHFLKGIKGARRGGYTAVWVFESRDAWERLWGSLEAPRPPAEYPDTWKVWENEILAPFLIQHPDTIHFTSYEEL